MSVIRCPDCNAACETMIDESHGRPRRRYFYFCRCGTTAPTPTDIVKRLLLTAGELPAELADDLGRQVELALGSHYDFELVEVERTATAAAEAHERN